MLANEDPYKTLGIEPDASIEEIKCAYRKAAIRWHPDVSQADPAESERCFRLVTDAYKHVLRDALLAAKKARKASQARADSDEPIRCGPHPDFPRFTPPPPSPRQRRRQTRSGPYSPMSRKEELDNFLSATLVILTFLFVGGILLLLLSASESRESESGYDYNEDVRPFDPAFSCVALPTMTIGVILLIALILSRRKF